MKITAAVLSMIGAAQPHAQARPLRLAKNELEPPRMAGNYMGSSIASCDIPRYIALWGAGRVPVNRRLTAVSPLADTHQLLDDHAGGGAIRQLVVP